MKSFSKFAALLLVFCFATMLSAQNSVQPGQLAPAPSSIAPLPQDAAAAASPILPKTTVVNFPASPHDAFMNRLWITSMFALLAGTGLDAGTSWGKREGNSLLASSDGTFGPKGLSIKVGLAAVVLVPQICLRKHKDWRGIFIMGNFGEAAIYAGTAIHNLNISSSPAAR